MNRRLEEEELDQVLREEYWNEADQLRNLLLHENDLLDQGLYTDEEIQASYGKLVEQLKAEKVYCEDTDEQQDKKASGSSRYELMVKRHRTVKIAGLVIVCILGVLAASMASEVSRNYIDGTFGYLSGDEPMTIADNLSEDESMTVDTYAESILKK